MRSATPNNLVATTTHADSEVAVGNRERHLRISFEVSLGDSGSDDGGSVRWEDVEGEDAGEASQGNDLLDRDGREHWRVRAAKRQKFWSTSHGFQRGRSLARWAENDCATEDLGVESPPTETALWSDDVIPAKIDRPENEVRRREKDSDRIGEGAVPSTLFNVASTSPQPTSKVSEDVLGSVRRRHSPGTAMKDGIEECDGTNDAAIDLVDGSGDGGGGGIASETRDLVSDAPLPEEGGVCLQANKRKAEWLVEGLKDNSYPAFDDAEGDISLAADQKPLEGTILEDDASVPVVRLVDAAEEENEGPSRVLTYPLPRTNFTDAMSTIGETVDLRELDEQDDKNEIESSVVASVPSDERKGVSVTKDASKGKARDVMAQMWKGYQQSVKRDRVQQDETIASDEVWHARNVLKSGGKDRVEEEQNDEIDNDEVVDLTVGPAEETREELDSNKLTPGDLLTVPTELEYGLHANSMLSEAVRELEAEEIALRLEQRAAAAQSDTPTDAMFAEVQELLELFGVPYIIAPGEAEAQCAWLDANGIVDGVITDDNDAFLFGARRVYRNIFEDRKYVEEYRTRDVETELGLERKSLVALAMLLGCDYTVGIGGVGVVNAMEIIHAFGHDMEGLKHFSDWLTGVDTREIASLAGMHNPAVVNGDRFTEAQNEFIRKHSKMRTAWIPPEDFPSEAVLSAFLQPKLDTCRSPFKFGKPDFNMLRLFCMKKLNWSLEYAREVLDPIAKASEEQHVQQTLDRFLVMRQRFAKIKSKRLQKAIKGIVGGVNEEIAYRPQRDNDMP